MYKVSGICGTVDQCPDPKSGFVKPNLKNGSNGSGIRITIFADPENCRHHEDLLIFRETCGY
jgi:hypothetical protein